MEFGAVKEHRHATFVRTLISPHIPSSHGGESEDNSLLGYSDVWSHSSARIITLTMTPLKRRVYFNETTRRYIPEGCLSCFLL
jgi:hypothetical protein